MTVEKNKVVAIQYVMKDDAGNVLHDNSNFAAEEYLHGGGNVLPALEQALQDMKINQEIDLIVPPDFAYGPVEASLVFEVSAEDLPDFADIKEGDEVTLFDGTPVVVKDKYDDHLVVDANHPLAGKTLHYTVKVTSIREALPEEIELGEPMPASAGSCGPAGCC
jgi:FKBP-type peptidyl-prolyl cis-trans isomerase SlyD